MCDEIEIMNGHELRRVARRHQQRVHGMSDVEPTAREQLHRWPLQPVPGEVERPHWDPAIDSRREGEFTVNDQPVLP